MSFGEDDDGWESWEPPPPPPPDPTVVGRPYGGVVPFEQAFHPISIARFALKLGLDNPIWLGGLGLGILLTSVVLPIELRIPLPESIEETFRASWAGLLLGYGVHRTLSIHVGAFVSSVFTGMALLAASRLVKDHDDPVSGFKDPVTAVKLVMYELVCEVASLLAAVPFVIAALLLPGGLGLVSVSLAIVAVGVVQVVTRPGAWALVIDDLEPRDALERSLRWSLEHALALVLLYLAYSLALVASVGAFAFIVIGGFHLGIAAAWVAWGATAEEHEAMPWLREVLDG